MRHYDAGSRLMYKFRSGTHGLIDELGRNRGRGERSAYFMMMNVRASHVLWDYPVYSTLRNVFMYVLVAGASLV